MLPADTEIEKRENENEKKRGRAGGIYEGPYARKTHARENYTREFIIFRNTPFLFILPRRGLQFFFFFYFINEATHELLRP